MNYKQDLSNIMNSLLGKEVDTDILLNLFSEYYSKSKEVLSSVLKFKVIQCTNTEGSLYKGIISFEDSSLTVNLNYSCDGCKSTYILAGL